MNQSKLLGRKIVDMRPMTDAELEFEGWRIPEFGPHPSVLVLDDGTTLFAGSDEEGNDPGTLMGYDGDDELFKLD
jgi:hypothetical protein